MGLESHIVRVLDNEPASGLIFGEHYWFENGLIVRGADTAEKLMEQLDESGQFGPTTKVLVNCDNWRIEFGVHESFLKRK